LDSLKKYLIIYESKMTEGWNGVILIDDMIIPIFAIMIVIIAIFLGLIKKILQ